MGGYLMSENAKVAPVIPLFGRREILTPVEEITRENLPMVLDDAIAVHSQNAAAIDYLYWYARGVQPILERKKSVRPEINNKVCENHASAIAQFVASYFLGEPITYTRRGERAEASKSIDVLNDYMYFEDKATHDNELANWMSICGVGYRMVLPDRLAGERDDYAPFELDTLDPRCAFVVYHSGFGHRRMLGVHLVWPPDQPLPVEPYYCGYTETHYFEYRDGVVTVWKPHALNDIPIFEYRLNPERMGSFEAAIPLLDAINNVSSNRVDGLEQFIQAFLKFKNCDIDEEDIPKLAKLGAIKIKSTDGMDCDVELISHELNQSQTQTLVDYLYDQVLVICGVPTTKKGGTSTSDTGAATYLRDGWAQTEMRARGTEALFKKSEREFLRLVMRIVKVFTPEFDLKLSEVECKFTRRQNDNLLTKTQSLLHMLEAGLAPEVAIATCGLFNDPMDVTAQSAEYLRKWDYVPIETDTPIVDEHGGEAE